MNISVDTNVLVRAVLLDDPKQSRAAAQILRDASQVAVSPTCLCEMVWVLVRAAKLPKEEVAAAIRILIDSRNVVTNRPAVELGLSMLEAGGDFADGVIAYEGKWLGGECFVSFDKSAVAQLTARGQSARLL